MLLGEDADVVLDVHGSDERLVGSPDAGELDLQLLDPATQSTHFRSQTKIGADTDMSEQGLGHKGCLHTEGSVAGKGHNGGPLRVPPRSITVKSQITVRSRKQTNRSPFEEASLASSRAPAISHEVDATRAVAELGQEGAACRLGSLRDDLDATIVEIGRAAVQTEFEGSSSGPPAETDTLDLTLDEGGQPHGLHVTDTRSVLAIFPCRTLCDWAAASVELFRCAGCGSEWLPTEKWTPRQADGTVPALVLARLERA